MMYLQSHTFIILKPQQYNQKIKFAEVANALIKDDTQHHCSKNSCLKSLNKKTNQAKEIIYRAALSH